MADPKKWRVTLSRWDIYVVRDVEAGTPDEAEEIALESWANDFSREHEDGGVNSVQAELDEP